ncbi:YebG family protein [Aliiglaciecola sp. CAU 1673]|uniref:YebG family protein n=1 Tax=Aliiglaciecola sp. CAU 1673 TaxID=3032595 RepID=UPI0023DB8A14|nr:YebG family protein [Aliiglaciecola sp. CAU 1673]MDF2179163.1 YebG family protein [Aliiglaciecola sp. CAU 1673]
MAVITKYVVEHKGVEKLVTTDKKEADQYDKMLEVADNLADYIQGKGLGLDEQTLETLSILLSQNKDQVSKLFKGANAAELLAEEPQNEAEAAADNQVVKLAKKKA